jgi:hypothetical protein
VLGAGNYSTVALHVSTELHGLKVSLTVVCTFQGRSARAAVGRALTGLFAASMWSEGIIRRIANRECYENVSRVREGRNNGLI